MGNLAVPRAKLAESDRNPPFFSCRSNEIALLMTTLSASRARRVDIVVYPGFKALEAIGTMSVFEYANIHLARQGQPRGYDIAVASTAAGTVPSDMLMSLVATKSVGDADLPDIAVIVGAREIEAALERNPALVH
jgi:transcriptional regulator GlxA family with amidase domain